MTQHPIKFTPSDKAQLIIKFKKQKFNNTFERCNFPKVFIHHPSLHPSFIDRNAFVDINFGMTMTVEVSAEITRTDPSLKNLSPQKRGCYLDNEFNLKFFKYYTQKNCEIECLTNYSINECGCVSQMMPFNNAKNISICRTQTDSPTNRCFHKIASKLLSSEDFSFENNCSCIPLCNSINYIAKYTAIQDGNEEATINVVIDMENIVAYRRYQQFSVHDSISFIGGLLGLFLGVSVLSVFELFYFIASKSIVHIWSCLKAY